MKQGLSLIYSWDEHGWSRPGLEYRSWLTHGHLRHSGLPQQHRIGVWITKHAESVCLSVCACTCVSVHLCVSYAVDARALELKSKEGVRELKTGSRTVGHGWVSVSLSVSTHCPLSSWQHLTLISFSLFVLTDFTGIPGVSSSTLEWRTRTSAPLRKIAHSYDIYILQSVLRHIAESGHLVS
jgi:hypothetical protein